MRVTDVMRTSVATVKPGTSIAEAARLLLQTNQRGLPVLDSDGALVGIISEGDLLHRDELGVNPPVGNWLEEVFGNRGERSRVRKNAGTPRRGDHDA